MRKVIFFFFLYVNIASAATLNVTVQNINGSKVSGAYVKLYDTQWTLVNTVYSNSSGIASFSGLNLSYYNYEVYFTGAELEFWGSVENVHLNKSTISSLFTRSWPYRYAVNSISNVNVGQQAAYQVTAKNPLSFARTMKVELWVDRDQQGTWDFHELSQPLSINSNSEGVFSFDFTPIASGTYFYKMNILTYNDGSGSYIITDSHSWSSSFEAITTQTIPINTGFMVYHSYSNYEAWDSKLYMFDFSTKVKTEISAGWNIDHAMNAHISPDGSKIVFMGDDSGEPRDWDIYLWTIGSSNPPRNLTSGNRLRDEDPKFSPDGTKIIFKQNGDLKIMNLSGAILSSVTADGTTIEESMPYYTTDGTKIIYAQGAGSESDIYMMNADGTNKTVLFNVPSVTQYYPIVRDASTLFYSKWTSATNRTDQIMLGYINSKSSTVLSINDPNSNNSDAFPIDSDYLVFVSTRSGSLGGYDLYLGQISTGSVWTLNDYGVNSSLEELGPCYYSDSINSEDITTIDETKKPEELKVFPNPSNGVFNITGRQLNSIEILSLDGIIRKISTKSDNTNTVNIELMHKGTYLLRTIDYENNATIQKIIIE